MLFMCKGKPGKPVFLTGVFLLILNMATAQCSLSILPANPTISCNGDSVKLCAVPLANDIDQSQTSYTGGTSARTLPGYSIFQSFTAGVTGTMIEIDMGFFNHISGSGTLKVFRGTDTTGTLLSTQAVNVNCPSGNCILPFPVNVPITAGISYTFQFIPGAGIPDPYGVQVQVPGTYPGGYFGLIDPSGSYNTGFDMVFYTHVRNAISYLWSTGQTDSCIYVKAAGTYSCSISANPIICTKSTSITVSSSAGGPNADAGPDKTIDCSTPTVVLNGSSTTPGVTYSWSGPGIVSGGNTATPTVNAAGTYTLTVTLSSSGCSNTDQAVVSGNTTPPNANAGPDKSINCSTPTVTLSGSSTTPGVTFSWNGPGIVSGGNTATPTVNAAGTYTLTVTQSSNGCTNTDQAVVSATAALPNANAGPDKSITCASSTVILNGSSTTPGVTFSWSGPGIVSGGNTATPTVNAAGTYTLTVTQTSSGCSGSDQAVVTANTTPPNANAGPDKVIGCASATTTLSGSSSTPGVTYAWSGPGIVSGGSTATPTVNAAGTYTLTVSETSSGCSNTDQAVVSTNNTPPNANAGPDKALSCASTSVVLNGSSSTPNVIYSWSGPGIVSGVNSASPTVNAAGTYTLTVTDTLSSCTNTDQAVVTNTIQSLSLSAVVNDNACPGDTAGSIDITMTKGSAPFQYNWSNGSTSEDLTNLPDGIYRLNVKDNNQCSLDTSFQISDHGIRVIALYDSTIGSGQSLTLKGEIIGGSGTPVYQWQPDSALSCTICLNPVATPTGDIDYIFSATDSNGCTASDTVHILVKLSSQLYFPNAFTPNNDGHNDTFSVLGNTAVISSFEMHVYNRWGEQVMSSTDDASGWDGTYKGNPAPQDTYSYYVKVSFKDNSSATYKGTVVLLR